jgi:c-di-GMP-binding flagellar brake protein YcgR
MGRLVDCSDDALTLEPDDVEPGVLLAEDDDYVAVAYLDGVKIQFDARLRTGGQERRLLRGPAPLAVYRLQRREAYRVAVTARKGHCALRFAPGDELAVGIVDLSARGLLLAWPRPTPPVIGTVWEHARIEFADRPPLPCTLVACRTDVVDDGSMLVGCEFGPLPPEIERAVQVLVNDLQRGTPTIS